MKTTLLITLILLTLQSCQPKSKGTKEKRKQTTTQVSIDIDDSIEGQYLAVFETVNPKITSRITGAFTFSREKELDEVVGDVRITNAGVKVIHAQNVRQGRRCPNLDDDKNHDGIIDATEGETVYGAILFPLDGDLSSQSSHDGEFPMGDVYGNYIYSRVSIFSEFISDLRAEPAFDGYPKLKPKEPLRIEGRAVVIHGYDDAADLPPSVGTIGRRTAAQTIPIACGIVHKVLSLPGEVTD